MPGCLCARGVSAKCSSARAATGANSTAARTAAPWPDANHCARRGAGTKGRDGAGTTMPSASVATAAGAAKVLTARK